GPVAVGAARRGRAVRARHLPEAPAPVRLPDVPLRVARDLLLQLGDLVGGAELLRQRQRGLVLGDRARVVVLADERLAEVVGRDRGGAAAGAVGRAQWRDGVRVLLLRDERLRQVDPRREQVLLGAARVGRGGRQIGGDRQRVARLCRRFVELALGLRDVRQLG